MVWGAETGTGTGTGTGKQHCTSCSLIFCSAAASFLLDFAIAVGTGWVGWSGVGGVEGVEGVGSQSQDVRRWRYDVVSLFVLFSASAQWTLACPCPC